MDTSTAGPSPAPKSGGLNPISYLREVRSELAKVTWPTREETARLTGLVVIVTFLVAGFVGALDFIFTKLNQLLVLGS